MRFAARTILRIDGAVYVGGALKDGASRPLEVIAYQKDNDPTNSWVEHINDSSSPDAYIPNHFTPWFRKQAVIGASQFFKGPDGSYPEPNGDDWLKFYVIYKDKGVGCSRRTIILYMKIQTVSSSAGRFMTRIIVN